SLTGIVKAIQADGKVVHQTRTQGIVPTEAHVVGETRLVKVRIKWRRQDRGSVNLFLVATTVGKEKLVARPDILIDSKCHRRIQYRNYGTKNEIALQSILILRVRCNVGSHREKRKHVLCDRAQRCIDLIAGKRNATTDKASRAGGRG